jgi:NAD(P)-dependent dehydrogenase (short-subunit alcohol dehydrogenase family)
MESLNMKNYKNKVAAITGAGSGIGRALSLNLAQQGCHLAIRDVDEKGMTETLKLLENYPVTVTAKKLNVADQEGVYAWANQVVEDH